MEERKTAAIVLAIIAFIVVFYTAILPEIRFRGTQTLSFKTCSIRFKYFSKEVIPDDDRAANNKLALCLCDIYKHKPDTAVANQILKIFKQYGYKDRLAFGRKYNLDSLLKNKKAVFDTLISLD